MNDIGVRSGQALALLNDKLNGGGVERMLSYMSCQLFAEAAGVVFLFDGKQIDFDYKGELVALDVPAPPYAGFGMEVRCLLRAMFALIREKKRRSIELCISHKEGPNFINVLSGVSRTIVTVHERKSSGIKHGGLKRWIVKKVIRLLYNRADCVVTVSQQVARDLEQNFGIRKKLLKTIYNPCDVGMVDTQSAQPLPEEHAALFASGPTIITVGRLDTPKGQWHLIRAFAAVRQSAATAKLIIVGEGDHLGYLKKITAGLGLNECVYFLGYQKNPFQYIKHADVFVLSSIWEGFGAVLLEAMACGVPVVSTDCQAGPREVLAPGTDYTVACQDIEMAQYGVLTPPVSGDYVGASEPLSHAEHCIARAVLKVLQTPSLRSTYSAAGRDRVQQFSVQTYIDQWRQVIAMAQSR